MKQTLEKSKINTQKETEIELKKDIDTISKTEEKKGYCRTNVYLCKPKNNERSL